MSEKVVRVEGVQPRAFSDGARTAELARALLIKFAGAGASNRSALKNFHRFAILGRFVIAESIDVGRIGISCLPHNPIRADAGSSLMIGSRSIEGPSTRTPRNVNRSFQRGRTIRRLSSQKIDIECRQSVNAPRTGRVAGVVFNSVNQNRREIWRRALPREKLRKILFRMIAS